MARVPDHGEKGRPVFLQLHHADAVEAGQFVEAARAALGHFDQRPVGENDIGRLLLGRRDRAAQGFQRGKDLRVRIARTRSRRPGAGGRSRSPRPRAGRMELRRAARAGPLRSGSAGRGPSVAPDQAARLQLPEHAVLLGSAFDPSRRQTA